MRISNFDLNNVMQHYMSKTQNTLANQNIQIATGKKFQQLSQDPMNANKSLILNNTQTRIEQYIKNADDVKIYLERIDTTLNSGYNMVLSSIDEGLKASNGTYNAADREAFAEVIEGNIKNIVELANSQYLGKYVFAGEKTHTKPIEYDGNTVTYKGDNNTQKIEVSGSMTMEMSGNAGELFKDTLTSLINLRDKIRGGNSADIQTAMEDLEKTSQVLVEGRTSAGVKLKTLESLKGNYSDSLTSLKVQRAEVEDVDMMEAIRNFMETRNIYKGTMQATSMLNDLTLLNYMK